MEAIKTLYTSDIHTDRNHLFFMLKKAEKEQVDRIIIGGDLVPHHLPDENEVGMIASQAAYLRHVFIPAIEDFKKRRDTELYLDFANDDIACNRRILEDREGTLFHLLHMKKYRFTKSVDIIGYMTVPPTPFQLKDWEKPDSTERPFAHGNRICLNGYISINGRFEETLIDPASHDTIENDLEKLSGIVNRPFLFVSHCPPHNTPLDVLYNGLHAGSISIKRFIAKWSQKGKLIASFHGHIHESPSRSGSILTTIENSLCFNPGQSSGGDTGFRYVIFRITDCRLPAKIDILQPI